MNKREAYKVLSIAPSADSHLAEQAYLHLTRKYRTELNHNGQAEERLRELDEAYSVLMAHGQAKPVQLVNPASGPRVESTLQEGLVAWARQLVESIRARWLGHEVEIAVLTTCLVVLAGLALLDGASVVWTLLVLAVALVTIWSPWRQAS
jgi:hypothetical protein